MVVYHPHTNNVEGFGDKQNASEHHSDTPPTAVPLEEEPQGDNLSPQYNLTFTKHFQLLRKCQDKSSILQLRNPSHGPGTFDERERQYKYDKHRMNTGWKKGDQKATLEILLKFTDINPRTNKKNEQTRILSPHFPFSIPNAYAKRTTTKRPRRLEQLHYTELDSYIIGNLHNDNHGT